ncbi:unnamed protein product [Vitrella brassicaformis CCMP3155]|uniref:Uncharacterized protein n=2 Tax=Vitrella brassicaformis TaxID=1169539 RepID=A0A0G4EBA8_VITBC|nr:unnamed protein product [Vitrella brassicaformis CCMP3155]|mmetsp:Transcript_17013/g.40864  ORF Transcript_17013/g.40864 Transcript_17013/m.40864 type:complete len:437 (+) Transcript_17013:139-1449(+)|eukprot:CEL92791.1 unnamed protein product [Vitrella brassicaformis CCMP3155]
MSLATSALLLFGAFGKCVCSSHRPIYVALDKQDPAAAHEVLLETIKLFGRLAEHTTPDSKRRGFGSRIGRQMRSLIQQENGDDQGGEEPYATGIQWESRELITRRTIKWMGNMDIEFWRRHDARWEQLFDKSPTLTRHELAVSVSKLPFRWPLRGNGEMVGPTLYGHIAGSSALWLRRGSAHLDELRRGVNRAVGADPVRDYALEALFSAISCEDTSPQLTRGNRIISKGIFRRVMKKWAESSSPQSITSPSQSEDEAASCVDFDTFCSHLMRHMPSYSQQRQPPQSSASSDDTSQTRQDAGRPEGEGQQEKADNSSAPSSFFSAPNDPRRNASSVPKEELTPMARPHSRAGLWGRWFRRREREGQGQAARQPPSSLERLMQVLAVKRIDQQPRRMHHVPVVPRWKTCQPASVSVASKGMIVRPAAVSFLRMRQKR